MPRKPGARSAFERDGAMERRLGKALEGWIVYAFPSVSSTMEVAHELADDGAPEHTLIFAVRQEQGRGRMGRTWASPEGGAYFSLILRPLRSPGEAPQLALVAGLAAAETLRDAACLYPSVRWPNDLLINGKKVGGILAEGSGLGALGHGPQPTAPSPEPVVIIGIGLNVSTDPGALPEGSTSLAAEGAAHVSREEVVAALCRCFNRWYDVWTALGFAPIREALRPWIGLFGQPVHLTAGTEWFEGTASDLDEQGRLVVRLDSGLMRAFEVGEVTLLQ